MAVQKWNLFRNPTLKAALQSLFDLTTGHDHDGVNSKTLSPSAVVANDSVTTAKILDGAVTTSKIGTDAVTSAKILAGAVTTTELGADAITSAKIADDAVDSEHIAAGAIDTEHIGLLQVTTATIAADAIDGTKLADNAVNSEHIAAGAIDLAHMSVNSVDSDQYVDGSIDTAHIADDQVTNAKLANISRGYIKVGGASDAPTDLNAKTDAYILIGDGTDVVSVAVSGDVTISNTGAVTIAALAVETGMIAADAIDGTKIADDAVDSEHVADGAIDTAHLAATTTPNAKTITAAASAAIPVTGNGDLALTIADAAETNTLAVPTFAGQEISISADTVAGSGSRTVTVASAINATGNNTILFDAAGEFIILRGIKLGATFAWRVVAIDGATLSTVG